MADTNAETGGQKSYKSVSQLKTAEDLCLLLERVKRPRQRREIDWKLNLAYARGNQYVYWNPAAKRVESVPTEDGEKPRYRVRIVSNQIANGTQSLLSKVIKTKPMFGATPGQPGTKAIKAAEFSEMLLEQWWRDLDLASKYEDAVLWSIHAGTGFWYVNWDPLANKAMKFLLGPDGQPITDQAQETAFRSELEKLGIEPQEKTVYLGDLSVEVLSPFHVWGDPSAKDPNDWKWCITQHNLDPDEVYARWGKRLAPNAVASQPDDQLPLRSAENAVDPNVVKVYCGHFLPSPALPQGRYVIFTESGGKQILDDMPWQKYFGDMTRLPVVAFRGIKVPGMAEGDAITTHARPLQKQLNRMLSQITEYFNLTVKPQWMTPVNALKQRMTNEPGAVWEYNPMPVGGAIAKPEPVQMGAIPPYVFEFLSDIGGRLREVYGLTEVTEGTLPPNLEAADAIDLLQEMATDRFAPTIEANERAIARAGQILLDLAQNYYSEPRLLSIRGFGGAGSVKEFTRANFSGNITVHVEPSSSLPRTRAGRRKQIEQWIATGMLDPRKAWRYYDIADIKDLAMKFAVNEDQALREHEKIIKGQPLNIVTYEDAIGALQRGMNPETRQPLGPQDDINGIVERAALAPQPGEEYSTHVDVHSDFTRSIEFENLDPNIQRRFNTHLDLTRQALMSLPQLAQEIKPPAVSLQIKGAAGPTTMAQILKHAGVPEADPQTLAMEPPMETMVIDSVDKPDTDQAGAGQEAAQLSQAAQTLIAAQAANATAALSNAQQAHQHQQKMQHAHELHQHAVTKAQADARLAEKKAQQSDFKPKPKAPASRPGQGRRKPRSKSGGR